MANKNMNNAKKGKYNEYYTRLEDIENELSNYRQHFDGKTVICNCDDPFESQFYQFFFMSMKAWNIKRLITTSYGTSKMAGGQLTLDIWDGPHDASERRCAYKLDIRQEDLPENDGNAVYLEKNALEFARRHAVRLEGDGDFRSEECLKLLDEADIVVTNPPFSLFREYVATLMEHGKRFLILGNTNSVTYKEIFPLIKENRLWTGYKSMGSDIYFKIPKDYQERLQRESKKGSGYVIKDGVVLGRAQAIWYTNLEHSKRNTRLTLPNRYEGREQFYPRYDNYDAIEVSKVADIPNDYFEEEYIVETKEELDALLAQLDARKRYYTVEEI